MNVIKRWTSINKEKITVLIESVMLLSLILLTNTVYSQNLNKSYYKGLVFILLLTMGILFVNSAIEIYIKKMNIMPIIKSVLVYYPLMLSLIIYSYGIGYLNLVTILRLVILPLLFFVYIYGLIVTRRLTLFFNKYIDIVIFLAIISLIIWSLYFLGFKSNMTTTINWGGIRNIPGYFNLHFSPQGSINFFSKNILRNTGVFTEAPMYSFVLTLSLLTHYFLIPNSKVVDFKSSVLVMTIISTLSTTGIVLTLFAVFLKLYLTDNVRLRYVLIPITVIGMMLIRLTLNSKFKNSVGSVSIRMDDFHAGYLAWKLNPLCGNGLVNDDVYKQFIRFYRLDIFRGNSGFSSGIMSILFRGGIIQLLVLVVLPTIFFMFKKINYLFFSILFLILLTFTVIDRTFIFILVISFFYIVGLSNKMEKY